MIILNSLSHQRQQSSTCRNLCCLAKAKITDEYEGEMMMAEVLPNFDLEQG